MLWLRSIALSASLCLCTIPQSARACLEWSPPVDSDILHADAIFAGKLERYVIVSPDGEDSLLNYALLTFSVDEVVKGEVPNRVEVFWRNSTYGLPDPIKVPNQALIATVSAENQTLPLRGPSVTIFGSERPDLPQLLQAPCSAAFIRDFNPDNLRVLREWMEAGEGDERDLSVWSKDMHEIRANWYIPPTIWQQISIAMALFVALFAAIALATRFNRSVD